MGLVGCFLSPVANQVSVDYLKTEDFARRPLAWLDLISRNPGTSISYSPTFGYDICARRMSSQTKASDRFDLSRWRIAGNGADMIRPDVMQGFVDAFADAGFPASAFLPSYGLAEATLAVTIMPPGEGIVVELVEETDLSGGEGAEDRPPRYRAIVNCGKPAKDMVVEIRDEDGAVLPEQAIGKVWTTGPSILRGYFRDQEAPDACLVDGWLDTGALGYMSGGILSSDVRVGETDLSGGEGAEDRPPRYRAIVNCGKPAKDMVVEIRDEDGAVLPEQAIGKVWTTGPSIMSGYFRDQEATDACLVDGWLDTGDMGYMSGGYLYVVGRAKDMIIINGKNHWPQDIEWAVEQLPGFKAGDIAAFSITTPGGEETPAVLVHCRTSDNAERSRLRDEIRDKVRSITGMNCVVELVPPRTLPRTSSGKLSRSKARNLYLSGEIQPYDVAA